MSSQLDRLSQWTRYYPRLCEGCWAGCCRLPLEASIADLVTLELVTRDEAEGSPKKLARRLVAAGFVRQYRASTGLFTIAQTPDGDCIFLGADRRCRVYDRRPQVCRRFPVEIGPRPGYCPARKIRRP